MRRIWDVVSGEGNAYRAWWLVVDDVLDKNDEIQSYIDQQGRDVPRDLIKLLADLDWLVRTGTTQRK